MIKAPLDDASPAAIASMETGMGHELAVVFGRRFKSVFFLSKDLKSKYCGASYKASMCVSE